MNTLIAAASLLALFNTANLSAAETNAPAPATTQKSPPVVTVKELIKDADKLNGEDVVLQGFVTDYCKRKGCWAMLHDADADNQGQIRVKQDEEGPTFKPFLADLQGKTISATGKVATTKIDTNYLDKWEARVKAEKPAAETDAAKLAAKEKADAATLKQIATLRERVAASKKGYLISISLAVNTWEPKSDRP